MKRLNYSTNTPWEPKVGYSRAVRQGPFIWLTGTTATDENGNLVGKGDPFKQADQIFHNIEKALKALGGDLKDVVRTRMFVTDIKLWQEFGQAHKKWMGNIMPATSMIEVKGLIDPQMLIEIEVDAMLSDNP